MKNIPTDEDFIKKLKSDLDLDIGRKSLPSLIDLKDPNAITPKKDRSYKVKKFCFLIRFYKEFAEGFFNFI